MEVVATGGGGGGGVLVEAACNVSDLVPVRRSDFQQRRRWVVVEANHSWRRRGVLVEAIL
ncbi:Hypothetical predicted protein [Olea europaea subsp. europaea]|uniref:Uncharacterized protein n=1 Tax=Olea europaea subsp. europaea TaxID=158383 RepID=A0A8S0T0R9_OLEEU|nr:Hypothetical predicted protein [Olea europaea subsp. europaea]